jgi:hypothetical protein
MQLFKGSQYVIRNVTLENIARFCRRRDDRNNPQPGIRDLSACERSPKSMARAANKNTAPRLDTMSKPLAKTSTFGKPKNSATPQATPCSRSDFGAVLFECETRSKGD